MAILPINPNREDLFLEPGDEIEVNQETRQAAFESYATTDDHLMHIVGISVDKGYLHMSVPYMKMKTVSITLHEDAVNGMLN